MVMAFISIFFRFLLIFLFACLIVLLHGFQGHASACLQELVCQDGAVHPELGCSRSLPVLFSSYIGSDDLNKLYSS